MKILQYDHFSPVIPRDLIMLSNELCKHLRSQMDEFDSSLFPRILIKQLPILLYLADGNLSGKVVLDLGCGSITSKDNNCIQYKPWLCRILYEIDAKPIGIDISIFPPSEKFEAYKIDLLKPNSLCFLPDSYVDIAHANSLFDSPTLHKTHGPDCSQRLMDNLMPQLERIVKKDGWLAYFN